MRVKVCGVTRPEDAELAIRLGATEIGVVFALESPRCVTARRAREISRAVPADVSLVGVFTQLDESFDEIVREAGLTGVQFHGVRARETSLRVFQAIEIVEGSRVEAPASAMVLLDSPRDQGSRKALDIEVVRSMGLDRPFYIAGGLTPLNVRAYIEALRPIGVDVSSGVESAPGIKSAKLLKAFFEQVKP